MFIKIDTLLAISVGALLGAWLLRSIEIASAAIVVAILYGLLFGKETFTLYRPPEDYMGVLYERGRFSGWVEPGRPSIIRRALQIGTEIPLHPRAVRVRLAGLLTGDYLLLDCEVKVYYIPSPRQFPLHLRCCMLEERERLWDQMVEDEVRETLVCLLTTLELPEVLTKEGNWMFLDRLTEALHHHLASQGFTVQDVKLLAFTMPLSVQQALMQLHHTPSISKSSQN